MKALLGALVLVVSLSACSSVKTAAITPTQISCNDTGLTMFDRETLGQHGCCSWHGGVCGCSGGRVVCCDNTYSPSCDCKTNGIIQ